jgi:aspartyl-tRNA(Asn)/glutamyl-tRNA(Gln) amidotransferase subunit A
MELAFLTIAEASALIQKKRLSPVNLVVATLHRIAAIDPVLCSYITVLEDRAMAEARAAEADIAHGRWRGPLHGIPIGLKDLYDTKGILTTANSRLLHDRIPHEDAATVRRLKEAGAIIVGKHTAWEFGTGTTGYDLPWPPARNPWNLEHDTSGSSSGSAAAIAAGLCLGALGSDTGGSVRAPAAWCGVAGFKPTYGLVSRAGIIPLSSTFDHAGILCWTSQDCAMMMSALAAFDPADPNSANTSAHLDFQSIGDRPNLAGLKVGVVRHFFEIDEPCDADTAHAIEDSLRVLRDLGASISDVRIEAPEAYNNAADPIIRAEGYAVHEQFLRKSAELYGTTSRQHLMSGAFVQGIDYVNAQRERRRLMDALKVTMEDIDVLVLPTARYPAPHRDQEQPLGGPFYTRPFNLTGNPALSVCNGFSQRGLPIAMQIVGRLFEDDQVLSVGNAYEQATSWRKQRPTFCSPSPQ